jgi:hypothetical protein
MNINCVHQFKKSIFDVMLSFWDDQLITPYETSEALAQIVDFLHQKGDSETVRAFTITKMKREGAL